jgi:Flp pilus assembly protein TadD
MQVSTELLQTLAQIGYMACFQGNVEKGQTIMDGVDANCNGQPAAKIGVAIARIYGGRHQEAINILKNQVLTIEPNNTTAMCFLGMALADSGQATEAKTYFEQLAEKGNNDEKTIANVYLNG